MLSSKILGYIYTLGYGINVRRTFINFWIFSQPYALIPDRTFIKFELMMSEINIYGKGCENNCFLYHLLICDPFYCNGYSGAFRLD